MEIVVGTESKVSEFGNTDESFDLHASSPKSSFVWQYFRQIEYSKSFECIICNSSVGHQTSNLSRHLIFTHNIRKHTNRSSGSVEKRGRPSISFIWKYCTKQDEKHARCQLCRKQLYFGGGNTENIAKHLRRKHSDIMQQEIQTKTNINESIAVDETAEVFKTDQQLPINGDSAKYSKQDSISRNTCYIRERKERKGGSYVWNYCDKVSRHLIRCNLCNKMMSFHGTANVITHLQRKHNIIGRIDGDRATLENTVLDLNIEEELKNRKEDESGVRPYRRNSSTSSIVWKYCTRVGRDVVRCGFCKKNLSYQGTSNLQRHLHRMHGVVTQMRNSKDEEHEETEPWKHFNNNFIWQHCSVVEGCEDKTKCNLCNAVFASKGGLEEIGKHLRLSHGIEAKSTVGRRKTRKQSETDDDTSSYDDDDFDNGWARNDFSNDATTNCGEPKAKNDEYIFDEIIEETPTSVNYEEEPFEPTLNNEIPLANPLSPNSSRAASPVNEQTHIFKSKKLQKLNEEKVRMETEYFREKAGFYRMQKYLTALQASKVRKELEQMNSLANGSLPHKSDTFVSANLPPVDNINNAI